MEPFTLLIKPTGSDCNLDCKYCFYKHRAPQVGQGKQRMSDEVLEKLVKDYIELRLPFSGFAWQGGEPTLMGLDFYKKVVELQERYGAAGQEVGNSLQTNAVLLNDQWCQFLHDNKFLVGISIDGPRELHDYYRIDHSGAGSFDKVVKAIERCKEHKVEFNTLTLLNNKNVEEPERLFDFLVWLGTKYLQFILCVEIDTATGKIADFSITPQQYGDFLCKLFDHWHKYDPKNISIRDFDSVLSYCITGKNTLCTFDRQCTQYIVVEHNGDTFCCDFFVEPRWRLGNIFETPIEKHASSDKKRLFARAKQSLCNKCLVCRHLVLCRGGCMKDRIPFDKDKFSKESYFCESYKRFFDYAMPRFMQIAAEISAKARLSSTPGRKNGLK